MREGLTLEVEAISLFLMSLMSLITFGKNLGMCRIKFKMYLNVESYQHRRREISHSSINPAYL